MAHKGIEMPRELLRELGCLTAGELREVISALQAMVVEALAGPEAEPDRCPRCGCERFVRCGMDKRREGGVVVEAAQRYLCKGCALRLCEVMAAATPPAECGTGDSCQVDGTYLNESMKGLGHRGGAMPRAAHRTGDEVKVPGISDLKVCVVVGVDDDGREFAGLCDRGHPTDAAVRGSLAGNVGGGCAAGTDGHSAYKRVLPGLGVTNHLVFPSDGSAGRGLWRVNAAHERLKAFLVPFNGVSTRYLPFYLKWWRFVEFVRRAGRDCLASLQDAVARGRYGIRREGVTAEQRPFWDYWEGKMTQSEAQPA